MKHQLRLSALGVAALLTALVSADVSVQAATSQAPQRFASRLDATLREVLADPAPQPQRVIIRVRPGSRTAVRQSLTAHGDAILAEHESLDAITAVIHGQDLATLAASDAILSVSTDAIVRPHGLPSGLLSVVKLVVNIVLPTGADTAGPPVPPAVLRATLGLSNTI